MRLRYGLVSIIHVEREIKMHIRDHTHFELILKLTPTVINYVSGQTIKLKIFTEIYKCLHQLIWRKLKILQQQLNNKI